MRAAVTPTFKYDGLGVPIIKTERMESITSTIVRLVEPGYSYHSPNVPILGILSHLSEIRLIQLELQNLGFIGDKKIRGKMSPKQNKIFIDHGLASSEEYEHLFRMTAAHELGHWVLHRKVPSVNASEIIDTDAEVEGSLNHHNQRLAWLERQAKAFAASLLLPREEFTKLARGLMVTMNCHHPDGKFYLSFRNQRSYIDFKQQLSKWFGVSDTAIEIRLHKLNLVENDLKVQSVGQILKKAIQ
ncbi:hypothetical protein GMSM_37750 [Geomonas sp. Red276]